MEGTISPQDLDLQVPYETTKVQNPSPSDCKFKQDIRYFGNRLGIRAGPIPTDTVKLGENAYGKYVSIPVSAWLRQQLTIIETFVLENLSLPPPLNGLWKAKFKGDSPYKKIWNGDRLVVSLSNWCSYFKQENDYLDEIEADELGDGTLDIAISIDGIYFGQLKDGKLATLTLRVQSILYKAKPTKMDNILNTILEVGGGKLKHANKRRIKAKVHESVSKTSL